MEKLKVLDLFAGIGGFTLGFEKTGYYETVAFCEIEDFPQKVLRKHWPNTVCYGDVKELDGYQLPKIDIITGGFPCQDISATGNQKGIGEGTRSGLFSEMLRLATECGRPLILFENVSRILSGPKENSGKWFWEFLWSLAQIGYDAEWFCITAASIGAPHERDRIWIVAYPNEAQLKRGGISRRVYEKHANFSNALWGQDKPGVVRTLNGLPNQMDRLAALGNAIVPEIATIVGEAIYETLIEGKIYG